MKLPLRFILSRGDVSTARRLLIVQSGSADLLEQVVGLVRTNHPQAALSVLLRRDADELPPSLRDLPGVEFLENTGSKTAMLRALRARAFDGVFVLYSNQPGYWKLKLLPFALGAGDIIGVNEFLGAFPVNLRTRKQVAGHLRWRWGNRAGVIALAEDLANAAAAPALLAYLLAYEKAAGLRARLQGPNAPWKRR